jgi:4-hydroxy-4-methyl-2-oxoglutarate aldolase
MASCPVMSEAVRQVLQQAGTGMVNDALALVGVQGSVVGVRPACGAEGQGVVGVASTVFVAPPHPDTPATSMYAVIRAQPAGNILVIDGGGCEANLVGDNNAHCALRQGLAGIIVNGGARDIAGFRRLGMPLFCTGAATRIQKVQITGVNVPIAVGGVTILPGDILVGDEDGVVAIPASRLQAVLERLKIVGEVERAMEEAIKRDAPVPEIAAILAKKKPGA